ncbi:MAG: PTS galactosamine/N-acetylgalactosamine transporter subunit IIA [Leptotrichiaceae bacterium]|nr:PTS galactosamine/N-acetylgalactosamine transporter subunit IIA [Leptotrichiaceae bacterium]
MTGIILTGHGNIGTGIGSAVELVFGKPEKFQTIDFTEGTTPELLEKKLEKEIDNFQSETLILTDIAGGTPFKTASLLSMKKKNVKVVSGMNLPMVLEVICERENLDLESLYFHSMEIGKSQITGFELNKNLSENKNDDFENGI